jgi:predicted GNAT family N-acyltransferase
MSAHPRYSREHFRCTVLDSPALTRDHRSPRTRSQRSHDGHGDPRGGYLAEQDCPIEEEFDGNDCAHFLGYIGSEPAGCLRVRFFGEFAKIERLAVRHQFRRTRVSFKLVQAAVDYIKRKGFRKIYGLAQDRLVNFWAHFGGRPLEGGRKVTFSDFSYTEMVFDIEPGPDAITIHSDPYLIIRPEGDWDRPGVLDLSAEREVTSPLRPLGNAAAAT